ncbi:MAG: DNA ligase D [Candidatus Margulisbacteria bacterium]|nr:DNA ligase D [Candidatus Margulisiibacteriota bacterium]
MALKKYAAKRKFSVTPEPSAKKSPAKKNEKLIFVIQRHEARNLHFDLRLELDGVLKSWAVPKGLPTDKSHLAVEVEDHPLEYAQFSGEIPKGEYGAGTVEIWAHGTYSVNPELNKAENEKLVRAGLKKGHLDFYLSGDTIRGKFTLIRMKSKDNKNWLFIKKTVKAEQVDIELYDAPLAPAPADLSPMLAQLDEKPFDRDGWWFEIKWDGFRVMADIQDGAVKLYSRNNILLNEKFPEVVEALTAVPGQLILDGEIVALDEKGISHFQALQDIHKGTAPVYYVFDILYYRGHKLTALPLKQRFEILSKVLPVSETIRLNGHIEKAGKAMFKEAVKLGLEGIIAKNSASPYRMGLRSGDWLKLKIKKEDEFIIAGFTKPQGSRKYFGALVLGQFEKQNLVFRGLAGTGFTDSTLAKLYKTMKPLIRATTPFSEKIAGLLSPTWVEPRLVCQIKFQERTKDGMLRHPVYLGLRPDKKADEVIKNNDHLLCASPKLPAKAKDATLQIDGQTIKLSHLNKLYWPKEKYTKKMLLEYYESMAEVILPYLQDRPQSLKRYPEGIEGESFFQKNMGKIAPKWIKTVTVPSHHDEAPVRYMLCQNEAALLYMVNLGCIDLNIWNSRAGSLDNPDYAVFDFDPLEVDFKKVTEAVLTTHKILDDIGAANFCKTSGASGMHIYVPLAGKYTYSQAQDFAYLVNTRVNTLLPDMTSLERLPGLRRKKVYLDYLQNKVGATMASVYSVRPVPGAHVSAPLLWEEVNSKLSPAKFTMKNMCKRLEEKGDIWNGFFGTGIDLKAAVGKLGEMFR